MPMWTEPRRRTRAGSAYSAPRSANIGTRETLSTPPATASARSPARTRAAVWPTASMPDAQKRLRVTPGHGRAPAGDEGGGAGEVRTLLVDLGRAAQRHVVDALRVDPGAFDEGLLEVHDEVDGGEAVQRPTGGGTTARRAHDVEDVCVVDVAHASSRSVLPERGDPRSRSPGPGPDRLIAPGESLC